MFMKKIEILMIVLTFSLNCFAQEGGIIYEGNPSPNTFCVNYPPGGRNIDFDGDSISDFQAIVTFYKWIHVEAFPLDSWQFYHTKDFYGNIVSLSVGDTLMTLPAEKWKNGPEDPWGTLDGPRIYVWEGVSVDSTIAAVRKPVEDGFCYGWIRFTVIGDTPSSTPPNNTTLIIHDYAYCTIPNYPLRAGQTDLNWGVEEDSEPFVAIHPNPANVSFTITGAQLAEARLYSVTGQLVATKQGNGTESLTMDISDLPSGLYFVTAIGKDGQKCVRKVVKQ